MGRGATITVTLVLACLAAATLDLLRWRCRSAALEPSRLALNAWHPSAGNMLWVRIDRASFEDLPLYLVHSLEPLESIGLSGLSGWEVVQWSEVASIPPLNLAIVSPRGGWVEEHRESLDPGSSLARLLASNPGASLLPASGKTLPEFLLIQYGGGFEGIHRQLLIHAEADAIFVWDDLGPVHRMRREPARDLPEPARVPAPSHTVEGWLTRAAEARLMDTRKLHASCSALDGGTWSFAYSSGERIGRQLFHNYIVPPQAFRDIYREIEALSNLRPIQFGFGTSQPEPSGSGPPG